MPNNSFGEVCVQSLFSCASLPVVEDAADGFGSRYNGRVLGTFGKYGVLSFNGNIMIATSGGGELITSNENEWREIMIMLHSIVRVIRTIIMKSKSPLNDVYLTCFPTVECTFPSTKYYKGRVACYNIV